MALYASNGEEKPMYGIVKAVGVAVLIWLTVITKGAILLVVALASLLSAIYDSLTYEVLHRRLRRVVIKLLLTLAIVLGLVFYYRSILPLK